MISKYYEVSLVYVSRKIQHHGIVIATDWCDAKAKEEEEGKQETCSRPTGHAGLMSFFMYVHIHVYWLGKASDEYKAV